MQDLGDGQLEMKALRNEDLQETVVHKDGVCVLSAAKAYGFRNIQNLIRKLKAGNCPYDVIEVMACPSGAHYSHLLRVPHGCDRTKNFGSVGIFFRSQQHACGPQARVLLMGQEVFALSCLPDEFLRRFPGVWGCMQSPYLRLRLKEHAAAH
jgi:hypothetical protein